MTLVSLYLTFCKFGLLCFGGGYILIPLLQSELVGEGKPLASQALAKGEKDTDQVLWNTGEVFSNSRSSVLRRRRQMYGKEEARKILNEEWKGGLNGNAERHFT